MSSRDPNAGATPEARNDIPSLRASALPHPYTPPVAGYADGPFLEPELVTPTAWRWRNARTFVVRTADGLEYRAVRVYSRRQFVGYWAVERLGTPLTASED